ncbi:DM13 domain-containing protein [Crocosphaera sp. XPORK-15E]|uniref:DM13 domain-containing protein n=1 Tax=Crocosphaera sp. XPORK-15E TaxID=3110247 RepID=UPI002B20CCAC|nr:DM13 domain-containing protein [Crocosphaera sp. XPORK-15E]MEA5536911.1 DM13 domain-containing protein [Crocosphaera sp. XPORK-15E]
MKTTYTFVLCLILFAAVGCKSVQQETANNTNPIVESSESTESDESTSEKESTIKVGSFVSGEHPTEGNVRIISEEAQTFIELDSNFKTSEMGPDLVVILHRSSDVIGSTNPPAYPLQEGDYVVIAPLNQFSGMQRYVIPEEINLTEYKSVAIWCRKFNATFGAAVIQ